MGYRSIATCLVPGATLSFARQPETRRTDLQLDLTVPAPLPRFLAHTIMFKRALAHQSNATPLRSSDKRKLVKDVLARYDFAPDTIGEDELRELGRMILPEGIRLSTIETSGGVEGVSERSPRLLASSSHIVAMADPSDSLCISPQRTALCGWPLAGTLKNSYLHVS